MTRADRVLSTPRITASKTNPPADEALRCLLTIPSEPMTPDDILGMAWWNALTERERAKWSAIAGNTGRPKDAWELFKRGSVDQPPPVDEARRRFLAVAAGASVASVGTLAVAAMPAAATDSSACAIDPAFALIAAHRAAEIAHGDAIDVQDEAKDKYGLRSDEAWEAADRCGAAADDVNAICWRLANTQPTTFAGVAAVLRFGNEVEDAGLEWPETDTIGPDGWHYQLRATMAAAIETLLNADAGKAVRS
jgi:hypothetical protein